MAQMKRLFRRVRRGESGAELVEFALALPMLMLVLMGIIDFGLLFQRYAVLNNAAREGARLAAIGYVDADVQARVNEYAQAGGVPTNPTTVVGDESLTLPSGAAVTVKRVTVTYDHAFPFVGGIAALVGGSLGTATLRAESTMRLEAGAGG